ncbi:class II aldolase/adducin family protein [Pseudophaeobacter sp.]|uniref:class II aldolase/adducin family protein n=1 Tax=Pseudophaeobacter sp. TaxID=1971739 RepID=UPI003296C669
MQSPYSDSVDLRQTIIEACLAMNASGVNQGVSGNISVRCQNGMLITPSGIDYSKMTPEMLVLMPLDGAEMAPGQMKPSSEWQFHRDILLAKPEAMSVVHAHPIYCTALAMNHQPIPACHYMVAAFGGEDVPLAGYALFGTAELSNLVVTALSSRSACLMANHGAVVTGDSLERALWRMTELEALAKGYVISLSIGTPKVLNSDQMSEVKKAFENYGLKTS